MDDGPIRVGQSGVFMMRRASRVLIGALAFVGVFTITAAPGKDTPKGPGGGGRSVQTRNSSGGISSTTSIPGESAFRSHGGGAGQPCYYPKEVIETAPDGTETTHVEDTPGDWVFNQGDPAANISIDVSKYWPALVDETIRFGVYCAKDDGGNLFLNWIDVSVRDPFFWDQATLDQLRADLQLIQITMHQPASVGQWGGVIVRNKVPLQINGDAWAPQSSPLVERHGVTLRVVVRPSSLAFRIAWAPNEYAASDAEPESWKTTCASEWTETDVDWFPTTGLGATAETQETGLIEAECAWSAPDSGEVTIYADITYEVFDVVDNVSEATPPYVWTGQTTWTTGQLRAVNVKDP